MFAQFRPYPWVPPEYRYERIEDLLTALTDNVIAPAQAKAAEINRP
jgi:hypothetical protein